MTTLPKIENLLRYDGDLSGTTHIAFPKEALKWKLSCPALMVYCALLERVNLSIKNGWKDDEGDVYAHYSLPHLAEDLDFSLSTIQRAIRELESRGLLERQQQKGRPVRHYPLSPASWGKKKRKSSTSVRRKKPDACDPYRIPADLGDLDWVLEEMKNAQSQ